MGRCLTVLSLFTVFLAGFLFVLVLRNGTVVRDEVSIKLKDYVDAVMPMWKKVMQQFSDKDTKDVDPMAAFKKLDKYLENYHVGSLKNMIEHVYYHLKMDFGLQKMCMYVTLKGFQNPIKVFVPSIQLCMNNDVFTDPVKYKLPQMTSSYGKVLGFDSFKTSFICMIVATISVLFACIFGMCKSTSLYAKWKKVIVVLTVICCIAAVVMTAAALLNINGNVSLKEKFDQGKEIALQRTGVYSSYYPQHNNPQLKLLKLMSLKETHGCAFYYAAVGILLLVLAIILNVVELCMKSEEHPVPYDKLKLEGI